MGQNLSTQRIDRHGPVRKTGKNAAFFWGDQLFPAEYIEIHWNTTFFLLAMPLLIPTWMLIPLRYSFTTWDVTSGILEAPGHQGYFYPLRFLGFVNLNFWIHYIEGTSLHYSMLVCCSHSIFAGHIFITLVISPFSAHIFYYFSFCPYCSCSTHIYIYIYIHTLHYIRLD